MKRKDLIRKLGKMGCILIRHGGKHDWYHNPTTRISQPVPDIKKSMSTWQSISLKCFRDKLAIIREIRILTTSM